MEVLQKKNEIQDDLLKNFETKIERGDAIEPRDKCPMHTGNILSGKCRSMRTLK